MLKRYLLVLEVGTYAEEKVEMFESENQVKAQVGRIAAGGHSYGAEDKLKSIYEVDLDSRKMKRLEPVLENMKIVLREVN